MMSPEENYAVCSSVHRLDGPARSLGGVKVGEMGKGIA